MNQPILIYEPNLSGHRAYYASVLSKALLAIGCNVHLAVPEDGIKTPEGKTFLADVFPETTSIPLPPVNSNLSATQKGTTKLRMLAETVKRGNFCHVYVPHADGVTQAWGLTPRPGRLFHPDCVLEGLMMRGGFAYPRDGFLGRARSRGSWSLQRRARWTRLHQLDPLVWKRIEAHNRSRRPTNALLPEAIEPFVSQDSVIARKNLKIGNGEYLIVCPGGINENKGCDHLAKAVSQFLCDVPVRLVLWGKHSHKMRDIIASIGPCQRITSVDRFATDREFEMLFAASDVVAVCYPRHVGSSSILIRAAKAGKQVLASDWGWVGWATQAFSLGNVCDATSPESIASSIRLLRIQQNGQSTLERSEGERKRKFLEYHTLENHQAHWTSLYRELHGLPKPKTLGFRF